MRSIPRALAVATGVALLVTACGGGESSTSAEPSEEPTSEATESGAPERGDADLVIWADENRKTALDPIAEAFGEENGITVEVQVVSQDLQTNFVTANTAGNGPDVVVGAHDWIGNLVQNGAIDPLQLTEDQLGEYSPIAVQGVTYNGQVYGLPYAVESLALYRNTALAPDAPATLEDAFAAGKAAVDAGQAESAFNLQQGENGDAYHMQPLYTSAGGYLFGTTPDGTPDPADVGVGAEGSIAAAQKIAELGEAGSGILSRSITGDNSIALFAEGQAAFLVSGPWALTDVRNAGIEYAISPIPGFAGLQPAKPFTGVQAFFVASQGENKAFAQEFVANAVNTEETMQALFEADPRTPAMTSVLESVAAEDPDLQVFAEAAEGGTILPAIPAMAAVWEPLGKAYAAIIGGADPVATMTTAGDTIREAIGG